MLGSKPLILPTCAPGEFSSTDRLSRLIEVGANGPITSLIVLIPSSNWTNSIFISSSVPPSELRVTEPSKLYIELEVLKLPWVIKVSLPSPPSIMLLPILPITLLSSSLPIKFTSDDPAKTALTNPSLKVKSFSE